ncbi:MAG: PAS domain-containing protein [Bacteroidia bacterium]|nr:PAS domain-containing protein [Bacteroidia bacterium]
MSLSEKADSAPKQEYPADNHNGWDDQGVWRYVSLSGKDIESYVLPVIHIAVDGEILQMNAAMQSLLESGEPMAPSLTQYLTAGDWAGISRIINTFSEKGENTGLITNLQTSARHRVRWLVEKVTETTSTVVVLSCTRLPAYHEPTPRNHVRLQTTIFWSPEQRVWKFDDQFEKLMGVYPDNIGTVERFFNRIEPKDIPAVQTYFSGLLSDSAPADIQFGYRHPDGQVYMIAPHARRTPDGFVITLSDTTPHDQFSPEELLDKLRLALSISGLGVWEYDPVSRRASWDDRMFDLYGMHPTHYVALETWFQWLDPRDAAFLAGQFAEAQPGPVWTREIRLLRPDGQERVVSCIGYSMQDAAGRTRLIGTHQDISVQQKALWQNKRLSDKLSIATQSARLGVWEADFSGASYWDGQMYEIYGLKPRPSSVNAYGFWIVAVHPDDYYKITEVTRKFLQGVIPYYDVAFRIVRPSGEIRYIKAYAGRIYHNDSDWRVAGVNWDITEQTLLEQEKDTYSERLKLATQGAQLGILDINIKTGVILWDEQMYHLFGEDPATAENPMVIWGKRIHRDDMVMITEIMSQLYQQQVPFNIQYRILLPGGELRYLRAFGQMIRDVQGMPVRLVGVTWDETQVRVAEQERIIFSNRLMLATQGARIGVWEFEVKTGTIIWDDITYEVMGVPLGLFEGTQEAWQRLLHPDDVASTLEKVSNALEGKAPYDTEIRLVPGSGIKYVHTCAQVIRDAQGHPERMVGIVWDITNLRSEEIKHQALLDAVPDMMLRLSRTGNILAFKPGFLPVIQHEGHTYHLDQLIREHLMTGVEEVLCTRQLCLITFQIAGIQDKPIHAEARIVPAGEHEVVCIIRDITQDVAARESLLHKNKQLEAFAELASHVLRKPTANVAGLLEILDNAASREQHEAIALLRSSFHEFDQALRSMALSLEELERAAED